MFYGKTENIFRILWFMVDITIVTIVFVGIINQHSHHWEAPRRECSQRKNEWILGIVVDEEITDSPTMKWRKSNNEEAIPPQSFHNPLPNKHRDYG